MIKKTPIPLSDKKAKLAIIHIAKKELGLPDDAYQALLLASAGIASARSLEYEHQFSSIMLAFKNLGFQRSTLPMQHRLQWSKDWGGTVAQRAKIEAMWRTCARNKTEPALCAFIKRIIGVDHPRFMKVSGAQKIILALEPMMRRAGYDPKTGKRTRL